ncbi:MAG: hypothetical protein Q4A09_03805 [Capnocytophaga felis]|nr:hypothetical protein [Capnocytophaga felis]
MLLFSKLLFSKLENSSANVVKLKRALVDKDILDDIAGKLTFQDPLYREWLKRYYFKIKY